LLTTPGLSVAALASSFYSRQDVDLSDHREKHNVATLPMEATREGRQPRGRNSCSSSTADSVHLVETYDRSLDDIFRLQTTSPSVT
jgi:TolB-like protein